MRSEASAKKLRHDVPQTGLAQIIVCDIASLAAAGADDPSFDDGLLGGCKAMVICTSAVPVLMKRSLVKALLLIPWNVIRGKRAIGFDTFRFKWKMGQTPQQVDYQGQKAQIDVARQLGMERVVLLSSMGGCDPNHPLNKIGKNPVDGSGDGDILLWKLKAEQYLVQSGLDFVIIHPGGLTDGPGGQDELVIDVDDKLIERHKQGEDGVKRSIHRADVAALCVAALTEGKNYAFDCVAGTGTSSASSSSSFDTQEKLGSTSTFETAKETLRSFVKKAEKAKKPNKVYSYSP